MSSPLVKRVQRDAGSVFLWDLKDVWALLASFLDAASVKSLRLVSKELSYAPLMSKLVWNLNRIHPHPALVPLIECGECDVGRTVAPLKHFPYLTKLILTNEAAGYCGVDEAELTRVLLAMSSLRSFECSSIKFIEPLRHQPDVACAGSASLYQNFVQPLTQLTSLGCHACPLAEEPLLHFPQLTLLEALHLGGVSPSLLGSLSHFSLVTSLYLFRTRVDDRALRGMSQLVSLRCLDCRNINGSCLLDMPLLTRLNYDVPDRISDSLSHLTQLRSFSCMNMGLQAACCLTGLRSLTSLNTGFYTDKGESLGRDVLPHLILLTNLSLSGCILQPAAFVNLTLLRSLGFSGTHLDGHGALAFVVPSVTDLYYRGMKGDTSISFRHLTALTTLKCWNCDALNDSAFEGLDLLTSLECSHSPSLRNPFGNRTSLTALVCNGCTSLVSTAFDGLRSLRSLDCSSCTSLSGDCFAPLTSLTLLNCYACCSLHNTSLFPLTSLTELSCEETDLRAGCFDSLCNLTKLTCTGCAQLGVGSFDRLTRLSVLVCDWCPSLEDSCFRQLTQLDTLDVTGCSGLTGDAFAHLTNLTSFSGTSSGTLNKKHFDHMTRLAKLIWDQS